MVQSLEQVTVAALALSAEERELLADQLLASISPDEGVPLSDEWKAEIERRIQEIDDGAETFPAEEVFAKIRAELRRKSA